MIDTYLVSRVLTREELEQVRKYGCFLIQGAINEELLEKVHAGLELLFDLPSEIKQLYLTDKLKNPLSAGYSPYGRAKALDTGIPNLLETWDINGSENYWPPELKSTLDLIVKLQSHLHLLAIECLVLIAKTCKIENIVTEKFLSKLSAGIHLIHYFPITREHPMGAVRQSIHADNTLLTLIPSANPSHSPLMIYNKETRQMIPIEQKTNDCVIQIGEALTSLIGEKLPACLHTIRDPRSSEEDNTSRYSTPYFVAPNSDTILHADSSNAIKYKDTANEYFRSIFGVVDD